VPGQPEGPQEAGLDGLPDRRENVRARGCGDSRLIRFAVALLPGGLAPNSTRS